MFNQFDVFLVSLNPTAGSEINKTRPCTIISPNEMNKHLNTVIIAPMTTTIRGYKSRCVCQFQGKKGEITLDQLRSVDKTRLVKKLGMLHTNTGVKILKILQEMFA